jgi:hypothetical protein
MFSAGHLLKYLRNERGERATHQQWKVENTTEVTTTANPTIEGVAKHFRALQRHVRSCLDCHRNAM